MQKQMLIGEFQQHYPKPSSTRGNKIKLIVLEKQ
jgi:hypothetical protein